MTEKPNYAIVRQNKIKSIRVMNGHYRHNARVDIPPHVDPEKLKLDRQLVGNVSDNYTTIFHDTIKILDYYKDHDLRKNGVLAIEVLLTYSHEMKDIDLDKWVERSIQWLKDTYVEDNVKSAVLHLDESTPHIHSFIIPVKDGKLKFYEFGDGPKDLSEKQTSYASYVHDLGLERGVKRSNARHQDMKYVRGVMEKALEVELPKVNKHETAEQYRERVNERYKEMSLQNAMLQNDKKRRGDTTKESLRKDEYISNQTAALDKQIDENVRLQQELFEYKKREKIIRHGIDINEHKDKLSELVNELLDGLYQRGEEDYVKHGFTIEEIVNRDE
ncbi:MAG: MobV family relaxase [Agathobacter sp.]|nr:MobV family relaxase [Agathobacter sp.]